MPVDVVIAPPLWTDMHESELKLKMRVRRIKDGRELRGGFTAFSSCFPDMCESKTACVLPLSLSQPCLPVANLGPTRVLPHLYLGSQKDVLNKELMAQNGITYVLNASNTCPKPDFISESHFLRVPVNDSYCEQLLPWLDKTNEFIDKAKVSNCRVMVHCLAGISRSATIAIAYIMKTMGLSSDDAYRFVKDRRPSISPNFNFLGQLLEFERELKLELSMACNPLRSTPSQSGGAETVEGSNGKSHQRTRECTAVNITPPSATSLQKDFSSLRLSTEQILHSRQLRCSLNLNIKSINSSNQQSNSSGSNLDPMPKLFKLSSPRSSECVYSCQEPESPNCPRVPKQTDTRQFTSTSLSLNLNLNNRGQAPPVPNPTVKSSLFLSLPLTTSSAWTKHRGMNHATTPVTPTEDHPWFFNSDLDRSPRFASSPNSSMIQVENQFKRRSCQFEDSIVTAHTSEDFGKLGKQSNFSGSMEVIEVS